MSQRDKPQQGIVVTEAFHRQRGLQGSFIAGDRRTEMEIDP